MTNEFFDLWLEKKKEEIIQKITKDILTKEDILILAFSSKMGEIQREIESLKKQLKTINN